MGQIQGPLKIQNFHPPSIFRRFAPPPYPGLQNITANSMRDCFGALRYSRVLCPKDPLKYYKGYHDGNRSVLLQP